MAIRYTDSLTQSPTHYLTTSLTHSHLAHSFTDSLTNTCALTLQSEGSKCCRMYKLEGVNTEILERCRNLTKTKSYQRKLSVTTRGYNIIGMVVNALEVAVTNFELSLGFCLHISLVNLKSTVLLLRVSWVFSKTIHNLTYQFQFFTKQL